jgi:hypothetical protein
MRPVISFLMCSVASLLQLTESQSFPKFHSLRPSQGQTGVTGCDPETIGDVYGADLEVSLVVEDNFDGSDIFALEEIFSDTFNREIDSFLDTCDSDYTQLFYVAVDDIFEEFQGGDLVSLTVKFIFFGYCQVDGPCDGDIVFEVIENITNEFEERVGAVIAAGQDGDLFSFFGT